MQHFAFALTLLLTGHLALGQLHTSVEWGTPVSFEDFQALPDPQDSAAASISVTIRLGYSSDRKGSLMFSVVAVMDKDESWMKEEFRDMETLRHEQGHFDIAHIYARKLNASLEKKRFNRSDIKEVHALYDMFLEQMNAHQLRYDRETQGGLNPSAQHKWQTDIRQQTDAIK